MNFANSLFDAAEILAEQERRAGIDAARRDLKIMGSLECEDCPQLISRERRLAMPSAVRCVDCQTRFERRMKRR